MHVMGSFGLQMDYTVRMKLRLADVIDGAILAEALARTHSQDTAPLSIPFAADVPE